MAVALTRLQALIDSWLEPEKVSDYAPNGLQVEGRGEVGKLVTGVTACQALLDAAVAAGADAVLVHHGYFWKGESAAITGIKRRRIQALLQAEVSLLAYHLPLDLHPELGNNARLAALLGMLDEGPLDPLARPAIARRGRLDAPMTAAEFGNRIARALGRAPMVIGEPDRQISTIGWCTGAAQGYIEQAAAAGVDAYLSGEISEPTVHSARENGIVYFAAGHHATERYGVQALGEKLAAELGIDHQFIDIDNPV